MITMNPRRDRKGFRNFHKAGGARIGMVLGAVCAFCVLFSSPLRAQIDESILPTIYQTTWAPGIPGGIPADNDPVRPATVWVPAGNPYGGYSVNPADAGVANAAAFSADFQAAINSAGAAATPTHRQIVLLAPGSYFVNPQTWKGGQVGIVVEFDNVTIRGSGATTTSIIATSQIENYGTLILFGHRSGSSDADFAVQNVTADALKGSTTIQVANASAYVVGDVLQIDHLDGSAALDPGGVAEFNGGYLWYYDAIYFKRQPTFGWNGPSNSETIPGSITDMASANNNAVNIVPYWRSTVQEDEITAISGNTLTLKDPLNIDFPLSLSPQVWRIVPLNTASIPVGNRWDGLEDIRVAGGGSQYNSWGYPQGCVALSMIAYSWVKDVDADGERWTSDPTNHPGKYGDNIGLGHCYRCEVTGSYSHGATDEDPGGQSYGITLNSGSTQTLVENNISINNNKPIALIVTGGGNVISYNYVDEAELWNSPGWEENAIDDSHGNFTHNDLIEGNWTANLGADNTHGNSGWETHFRNYSNGNNLLGGPMTSNLRAVGMMGYTHFHAYVGNVLQGGTVYQTTPTSTTGTPIYQLGVMGGGTGVSWDDGYAEAHIYRDANWDNVSGHIVWNSSPETIPNSLYLTSAPAFFSGYTWPWVDPLTGSAPTDGLPAKARYDSGQIFPPPPTFTYTLANGGSLSVTQGSSVPQTVTATLTGGTASSVSYAVSGLPTGATLSFPACTPTCTSTGTLATTSSTPAGAYTITVTGAPNSMTTSFTLTVSSATTLPPRPTGSVLNTSSPLAANLVGLFIMNESTGATDKNLVDSQVANFSGSALPTWNTTDPSIVFNGGGSLNSYLNAGTDLNFDQLPTSQMTIVAKVYVNTLAAGGVCEKNDDNATDSGFVFGWDSSGAAKLTVERATANMRVATAAGAVTAGQWIQVAFTWDGTVDAASAAHLFVNGTEQAKVSSADGSGTLGYANATNRPFNIGNASFDFAGSLNGKMAYLAVYKGRILTPAEMGQLDAQLPITASALPPRPAGSVLDTSSPLAPSLAGLFIMNESTGATDKNLVDSQVANFSGSALPTWNTTDPSIVFNGGGSLNSYLNAGTDLNFDQLPTSKMTIVAKVYVNTLAAGGVCEKNDNNATDSGFVFGWDSSGAAKLTVERATANMRVATAAGAVTAGQWIQVAFTWDGTVDAASAAHLFVNGTEQAKVSSADGSGTLGYANATNRPFNIGNASFDFAGSLNGKMAYLAVYKGRILTPAEMGQLDAQLPIK